MMKNEFKQVLLGRTNEGRVVFANVRRDAYDELRMSFDVVAPFIWNRETILSEVENYLDNIEKDAEYDLLVQYDCRPSEIVEVLSDKVEVEDIMDISLYSESFYTNYQEVLYFRSEACGQVGVDAYDYDCIVNEELFNALIEAWKKYNCEVIDDELWSHLQELLMRQENLVDEEATIQDWVDNAVFDDFV